jgi:hypothetical protein
MCPSVSPDLDIRWGESLAVPCEPPPGCVMAQIWPDSKRGFTLTRTLGGFSLRFNERCDFCISADLSSVQVHPDPRINSGIVSLLLSGTVMAFLFTLRGEAILHASTVEAGGRALAFLGSSNMGKSTLAALLCCGRARLISDDLLRLRAEGDTFLCYRGTPEIRLRPEAAVLADLFPVGASRRSADGRLTVRLDHESAFMAPLHAIVIPRPSPTNRTVRVDPVPPLKALFLLNAYARVCGWKVEEPLRRQFQTFARLVKRLTVYEAEVPWGPPFAPELSESLLKFVGMAKSKPG